MGHKRLVLVTFVVTLSLTAAACGSGSEGGVVLDAATTSTSASGDAEQEDQPGATTTSTVASEDTPVDIGTETTELVDDPAPTTTSPQAGQGTNLTDEARISTLGLGPVYMGDTLTEVAEKIGVDLLGDDFGNETCRYYRAPGGPPGVLFMVAFGRIARVDITDPSIITTRSGAGIGSTKQQLIDLFGDKIVSGPHPYTDGEYLTFVPVDEKDGNLRIIFETNASGVVMAFRTGQLPEVEFIEGCA